MKNGPEKIKCKHSYTIYEKDAYKVVLYTALEELKTPDGKSINTFTVTGNNLPTNPALEYEMAGDWKIWRDKNQKDQWNFDMVEYKEIMPSSKEGIIKYLSTLKGIGKVTATKIYTKFGNKVFDVLESDPDKLLEIPGIRTKSLDKIKTALAEKGAGKELFAYLYSFDISASKIMQIYKKYGNQALENVKKYPYELTEIAGIGFKTADKIAHGNGLPLNSKERIEAGIYEVLTQAENGGPLFKREVTGHMYLDWETLTKKLLDLLSVNIPYDRIAKICLEMKDRKKIFIGENKYFYRHQSAIAEYGIAKHILRLLRYEVKQMDHKALIARLEGALRVKIASEQLSAVETGLNSTVSIITGGPGTGKTMIQRMIIEAYSNIRPSGRIVLAAPTGRAARKMSESTGYPASTIHQLLGIYSTEDDEIKSKNDDTYVEADLLIIDESSMLDTFLSYRLFSSIRQGTQVVIVGDVDQLPSVGAGCVLRALINSKAIPTVYLTRVYRQKKGSSIAINAARINKGEINLEYDSDFQFHEAKNDEEIIEAIKEMYKSLVTAAGIDNVMVLSPFRQKTETGVDSLNLKLRNLIQPHSESDKKLTCGKMSYYLGDKVMQTKNTMELANGDIGYVKSIKNSGDGYYAEITFDGNREAEYYAEDAADIDLAYATTIHKAQGSESIYVILVVSPEHRLMLKRNLLYTSLTRAREGLRIIGSRTAFEDGIKREDVSMRNTNLDKILNGYAKQLTEKQMTIDHSITA
ncbi:MAG: ATP-dependent RecD-like DNA helicase [Eubacteriales bacterium]|nr:ATP-dependent RecD-like DNA helicase [Eubacteriales bacterium]